MTNKGKGLTALIEIDTLEEKRPTHVDEFIAYGTHNDNEPNEKYARWVLDYFRGSAICKNDFHEFMKDNLLFCRHNGEKWRVTGASRLGDIWLTSNFEQDTGYELRVMVDACMCWDRK